MQQSGHWKPNLNPNNIQIGNANTNELEIKPTICNLEIQILQLQTTQHIYNILKTPQQIIYTHLDLIWSSKKIRVLHIYFFIIEALCPLGFGYLHIQQTTKTPAIKNGAICHYVMFVCMASYMTADYEHANHAFRVNVRS